MPLDHDPQARTESGADQALGGGGLDTAILDLRSLAARGRQALEGGAEARLRQRSELFQDLFVLELANNHWGSLDRGLAIIQQFGEVARANGVKAAVKLQFRDVETFVHKAHQGGSQLRYPKKVWDTKMPWADLGRLVEAIREAGMITMSTPFDEVSVEKCVAFDVEILKIASSDLRDTRLVDAVAETRRPTIMSTGGSALADVDGVVELFNARGIPLAINHCVSIYPSEDSELELNQIDFLVRRYPNNAIGFSTHECTDWQLSVAIAYAKGARTFERHIDIDQGGIPVSAYCTLPEQADVWFKAFNRAKRMCGAPGTAKRVPPDKEVAYLDALVRGVYAKRPLAPGEAITGDTVYLAVPLQPGQMSCRDLAAGGILTAPVGPDGAVMVGDLEPATDEMPERRSPLRARGR